MPLASPSDVTPDEPVEHHWLSNDRVVAWTPHLRVVTFGRQHTPATAPEPPTPLLLLAFAGVGLPAEPDPALRALLAAGEPRLAATA